jgi:Domain of unknown function (DUF4328)
MESLNRGIAKLKSRSQGARYLIIAYLGFEIISIAIDMLKLGGLVSDDDLGTAATVIAGYYAAYMLVFIGSIIAVSMWIHRAHANLFAARLDRLEYTPGWSVGWFFVPIMNLFKPFHAMRELYNRSHGQDDGFDAPSPSDLTIWWGCYIVGSILGNLSFRLDGLDPGVQGIATVLSIASSLVLVGSAIFLKKIIEATDAAQGSMLGVAGTFA